MMPSPELLDDILLSLVEGVGPRTYHRLMERFGSSTAILDASRSDLAGIEFVKHNTALQLTSARENLDPTAVWEYCRRRKIDILSIRDLNYPQALKTIDDPPPILYLRGTLLPRDAFSLAIVGTRRATNYGLKHAATLSISLARLGLTIVSGLALGIDGAVHRATLEVGGRTLAVLGGGHSRLFPPEHEDLAEQIVASGGAVLSEYPPLQHSSSWTFPQRNRIVSGLTRGVLVVEAPVRSGAMITARLAGEQGRDVFALPGSVDSKSSCGCHQLIRDGAYLVETAEHIIEILGPLDRPVALDDERGPLRHPGEILLEPIEQDLLQRIGTRPTSLETLAARSGLAPHQIRAILSVLEEKRLIRFIKDDSVTRI